MTDSFELDAVPVDISISDDTLLAPVQAEEAVSTEPNGFELLGLAPELVAAVKDLGYTQPTTVQSKTIPLAQTDGVDGKFNDLMVSSQTGSGKTAAFLLPVLNTLIEQMHAENAKEEAEWQAVVAAAAANGEAAPKRPRRKDPTLSLIHI